MKIYDKEIHEYVDELVNSIRKVVEDSNVLAAVSGGIDSTVAAYLTWLAIGDRVKAYIINTGFMREDEVETTKALLENMGLPVKVYDASDAFYSSLLGKKDAEEKRKIFREIFYETLAKLAKDENAQYLVQGTIAPDWIETVGKIKTQHNVLAQLGIKTEEKYGFSLLEPLANLYKDQVRAIANYLKVPKEIIERQPFPGPGLLVRCVGEVELDKLKALRNVTALCQDLLMKIDASQSFLAIFRKPRMTTSKEISDFIKEIKNIVGIGGRGFKTFEFYENVTGVKGDSREYSKMLGIYHKESELLLKHKDEIVKMFPKVLKSYIRVAVLVSEPRPAGKYAVSIRAVKTSDFMTASVPEVSIDLLQQIVEQIMKDIRITQVYYDITPKPPATIEYE
ncbi:MAG TPA: ATP-binding protein [Geobacterales bacterium]|nr:ATP-binding protein [Geobacterales bacterium]